MPPSGGRPSSPMVDTRSCGVFTPRPWLPTMRRPGMRWPGWPAPGCSRRTGSNDPAIGRRGGMTWIGDNSIELGEPIVEGGAVDRFIKRFGSHMSSIAVQVADIDATIAHLGSLGVRVASRIDDVIVFTDPRTTAGVVIEWYGSESENDPRFGTPIPPYSMTPLLEVSRMAFGGAVVDDPPSAAAHLANILGTTVTFVNTDAPPGWPARRGVTAGHDTGPLPHSRPRGQQRFVGSRLPPAANQQPGNPGARSRGRIDGPDRCPCRPGPPR